VILFLKISLRTQHSKTSIFKVIEYPSYKKI
jgi:hypothetical protein